jgi:chloramphenicol O-acetyltransferase
MTPEIYAYIKAYGRCDEDKMRFMGHAGGEYDENGKTKSVDASSSNVFSPIVGNEEVAKEQLAVFWKQAIVDLEAQLETADEGKKVLLQADIVHAKKQLEEIKN